MADISLEYTELEILGKMASGLLRQEIAQVFNITLSAVDEVLESLYKKLDASSDSEVLRIAIEIGLINELDLNADSIEELLELREKKERDIEENRRIASIGVVRDLANREFAERELAESGQTESELAIRKLADELRKRLEDRSGNNLPIAIDAGSATPEEIGEFMAEYSKLYRMLGGSGLTFSSMGVTDVKEVAE